MWENGSGSMASGMDPSEGVRVGGEEATSLAFESMRRIESPHPSPVAGFTFQSYFSIPPPQSVGREPFPSQSPAGTTSELISSSRKVWESAKGMKKDGAQELSVE